MYTLRNEQKQHSFVEPKSSPSTNAPTLRVGRGYFRPSIDVWGWCCTGVLRSHSSDTHHGMRHRQRIIWAALLLQKIRLQVGVKGDIIESDAAVEARSRDPSVVGGNRHDVELVAREMQGCRERGPGDVVWIGGVRLQVMDGARSREPADDDLQDVRDAGCD